jgi:hypothetical protein
MKFIPAAMLAILLGVLVGCEKANPSVESAGANVPKAVATPTKPAYDDSNSSACKYTYCTEDEPRLYWFVEQQKNSLSGDEDWWQPNRSAGYENRAGHPTVKVECRNNRFEQAQLDTAGVFLESAYSVATVRAKVDGVSQVFHWDVAKDDQTIVLSKAQFRELLKHRNIMVLGIPDYHGVTYNMILQVPPLNPEFRKSCGL